MAEETVGCGVDLMQDQAQPDDPEPEDDEEMHKRLAPHLRARGAQFRRRHRLQGQFLLYGGRIDAGKGCEELIEYFTSYKEQGGEAQLALMGVKLMQLPEVPWVRFAGLLSERERLQALEAATIVVVPSPLRELVAAGARGDGGRHAGALQRARGGAGRALPRRATPGCSTRIAMSSWSARSCCSPTSACAIGWAATARSTSSAIIAGT